ncbi:MAG: hypothetical protein AAFW84_32405 [Cyanobacteria bacterium J06635_15]
MTYDPTDDETIYPAAYEIFCKKMAQRYNWKLKEARRLNRDVLPVDCIFEGDVEFPKSPMDWSKGRDV